MSSLRPAATALISALLAATPASAGDPWARPWAATAQAGFGTPTGYYGVTAEYAPTPLLVAAVGVGNGSGPYCKAPLEQPQSFHRICGRWDRDLQLAAQARLRLVRGNPGAFSLGAGLSTGGYTWVEFTTDGPAYKTTERAHWFNAEASWELRDSSGLSGRLFAGYGFLLNPGDLACVGWGAGSSSFSHCQRDHAADGKRLFYLGASAGWAF